MGTQKTGNGIDRRQFLRRAAVAGAAAAWTAPVVKSVVGTPAFAQSVSGSPNFQDLSYVVVCYSLPDNPGTCCVKWDLDTGAVEAGNVNMPDCGGFTGATCGDPSLFSISGGGPQWTVCLTEAGIAAGVHSMSGTAKCGSSQTTSNPCVGGQPAGENCLTFGSCGGA